MPVPAAISLVTLGVADVAASTAFYESLGFRRSSASVAGEVSFFHTAGGILAVWGRAELAADSGFADSGAGSPGVSLAVNVGSRAAVDAALADAQAAGARITRAALATDWGGYNGYFADPDGHLWEVAHNPHWPLDALGLPQLP
jgi:catechol 2,3-dioxygenase-like lactoylglutathione lyase family enzyme